MKLDRETVEHIAWLARMRLTPEEVDRYTQELTAILEYIQKLSELDTEGVPPTVHAIPIENVFREDEPDSSLPREHLLEGAPSRDQMFYRVPKVIWTEPT